MRERIRVGIVGLAFGERVLLPAFLANPACEVVGVAARRREHAQEVSARTGIAAFDGWEALVRSDRIDAVVVATPPPSHAPIVLAALGSGKHVFCEKPLADTLDAATRMATAAAEARLANVVDFELPEIAEWQRARALIAQGAIGRVRHVDVSWQIETFVNRQRIDNWKTRIAEGGGALNEFASHVLYHIEWLAAPIDSLWTAPADDERDRRVVMSLRLAGGATGAVVVSTAAPMGSGHAVTVYGEEATLSLWNETGDHARGFVLRVGTRARGALDRVDVDAAPGAAGVDGRTVMVGRIVQRFVEWIQSGCPTQPSFAEGVRVQALVDAAWRSRDRAEWCMAHG
jgi:predicted dehydrogenase